MDEGAEGGTAASMIRCAASGNTADGLGARAGRVRRNGQSIDRRPGVSSTCEFMAVAVDAVGQNSLAEFTSAPSFQVRCPLDKIRVCAVDRHRIVRSDASIT